MWAAYLGQWFTLPTWRGFQYPQNISKILLYVYVDGDPGPCPKAALLFFLTISLLSPIPSLWLPVRESNPGLLHDRWGPSLNHYYKTSHYPLQGGTHSSEGRSPLGPLCLAAVKLFFSTSPKTLSLRFNSVPGDRGGWIRLQGHRQRQCTAHGSGRKCPILCPSDLQLLPPLARPNQAPVGDAAHQGRRRASSGWIWGAGDATGEK